MEKAQIVPPNKLFQFLQRFSLYILGFLAFLPLGWFLVQQWADVRASFQAILWSRVVYSFFGLAFALPIVASISWVSLVFLNAALPFRQAAGIYFLSQIPKYLPGGIWAFPGRMLAYQMVGVPKVDSVISVFREVAALFLGAVLVGLIALFQDNRIDRSIQMALLIGVVGCVIGILITQLSISRKILAHLPRAVRSRWASLVGKGAEASGIKWLFGTLPVSLIFWLILGIPFYQLILAVSPQVAGFNWLDASGIFALAWSAGFVVFLVPAGFGVRETILSLLLSRVMSKPDAVSVALLSRIWWMAGEAFFTSFSWWVLKHKGWLPGIRAA